MILIIVLIVDFDHAICRPTDGLSGSGGTGETHSQLSYISEKTRLRASGEAGCLSRVLSGVR